MPQKDETSNWPASKVELWPITKIKPYEKNPRVHPPAQIDLLAESMREDGVTAPILVDEKGIIIYGHGRRLAALKNGFKRYPVVVARGWTETQKKSARIKDNSLGFLAGWDKTLLATDLMQLKTDGYDMKMLGFGDAQLVAFMTTPTAPGEFAALNEETVTTDFECPVCRHRWSGRPKP